MMIYLSLILIKFKQLKNPLISLFSLIDDKSRIHPKAKVNRFVKLTNSTIDSYSYIGPRTKVINTDIGKFCSISWDCEIGLNSHKLNTISTSPIFSESKNGTGTSWIKYDVYRNYPRVQIGCDVWIGARSIIFSGVTISHGAVVGAGAIVTKDVPPYAIVVGVPAKIIGYRFSDEIIKELIKSSWWDSDIGTIKSKIDLFNMELISADSINSLHHSQEKNSDE